MRSLAGLLVAVIGLALGTGDAQAIIGGVPAEPGSAPSTVIVTSEGRSCSAVVVGPQAVVALSQCLATEAPEAGTGTVPGTIEVGGEAYSMDCFAPSMNSQTGDMAEAWALCITKSGDLPVKPERVNTDPSVPAKGDHVTLTGYGCSESGDRKFGLLRTGEAEVYQGPADGALTTFGSAVCFGDGGGGAFLDATPGRPRLLVGLNWKGNMLDTSRIIPTSAPDFVAFLKSLADKALICGISADDSAACDPASRVGRTFAEPDEKALAVANLPNDVVMRPVGALLEDRSIKVSTMEGESLLALVARVCGPEPEDYFERLLDLTGLSSTKDIPAGPTLELPLCTSDDASWYEEVTVAAGDTLWGYFNKQPQRLVDGSLRWIAFKNDHPDTSNPLNSRIFLDAFETLNPGLADRPLVPNTTVLVPTAPPRGDTPDTASAVSDIDLRTEIAGQVSISDVELQEADLECEAPEADEPYPYDLEKLLYVLMANHKVAPDRARTPPTIVLADSGLYGAGGGIFSWGVVQPSGNLPKAKFAENVLPVLNDDKMTHGTQVASLLLGGPLFSRIQNLLGVQVIMRVAPRRVYVPRTRVITDEEGTRTFTTYVTDPGLFANVLAEADRLRAEIVNLSLKKRDIIPELEQRGLGVDTSDTLFVVAAGNGDGELGSDSSKVYPAMYGTKSNVLVVGSVGGEDSFALFSNFNRRIVQISAPGCEVPVLSFDAASKEFVLDHQSGTSLSTPLVSFAAALVNFEGGPASPIEVKERLLASADLSVGLDSRWEDGRVLDIPKAAAVLVDVVEVEQGGQLLAGNLTFVRDGQELTPDDILRGTCRDDTDEPLSVRVRDVIKISPNYRVINDAPFDKVYFRSEGLGMVRRECSLDGAIEVKLVEVESGATIVKKLADVFDVVPRMRASD